MSRKSKGSLIGACIDHAKLVWILISGILVAGVWSLTQMSKDEFPAFTMRFGIVAGVYPGADAQKVHDELTVPLEEFLFELEEVDRENTYSVTRDGMSYTYVSLDLCVEDKDVAWSKIRAKIADAKLQMFPPGVLAIVVIDDFYSTSTLLVALESPDRSYREISPFVDDLTHRLRAVPGTGRVRVLGEREEEIAILLSQEKMEHYSLTAGSLLTSFMSSSTTIPTASERIGERDYAIYVDTPLEGEAYLKDKVVSVASDGKAVRLEDIATLERRYAPMEKDANFGGNNAIIISIEMRKGNNIVSYGERVQAVLDDFTRTTPPDMQLTKITDQPKVVRSSVFSFLRDLVISMLVVILVMLMLFPMRTALVASSGLPICTAVSIGLMYLTGIELNTVTLAALIVVLGMIVDDSIINIDGYIDKLRNGYPPREAAISSAKELFMPMLIATAAISAMFFPMTKIITGPLGDFVQLFPWTVAYSLAASLVYAMLVIPALEIKFIKPEDEDKPQNLWERGQRVFFNLIQNVYEKGENICFRHPYITVVVGLVSIVAGGWMFTRLNVQMMPNAERDSFAIELYMAEGTDIETTAEYSDSLQRMILGEAGVTSVTAFIGDPAPRFHVTYTPAMPSPNIAQLIVGTESKKKTLELLPYFENKYADIFPNARVRIRQMDYQAASYPVEIFVLGPTEDCIEPVTRIEAFLKTMPESFRGVHSCCDQSIPSVHLRLKGAEAAALGVNEATISLALASVSSGVKLMTLRSGEGNLPVNLYQRDGDCSNFDEIGNILVPTSFPGVQVPLRQVADIIPGWGYPVFERRFGKDCITIDADMMFWKSQPRAMKPVREFIDKEIIPSLPEGVEIRYGGLDGLNGQVIPMIVKSFIAAVVLMLIFLLFYFKKFSISLLTLCMSSLCLFGAFFGEWLFGLDFGMTSVLGVVALIGIIVRNGIVMYEYAEHLREDEGLTAKEAAYRAGARRMRPIFLTSATTALGVIPMIISGSPLWMPMGVVICFGVVLSMLIILAVMPVSYWLVYRKRNEE